MEPPKKIDILKAHMEAGRWDEAIRLASKFPRLGAHKAPITRAASALTSPAFYRGMKRDPEQLRQEGIQALRERYG